jgi:[ribosomal protein S5]-alanine N-acetyltransferase
MLTINLHPFPQLNSERLHLRQITKNDAPTIFALHGDAHVIRYTPLSLSTSIQDAYSYIEKMEKRQQENSSIDWAVTLNSNNEMIGIAGLYSIQPQHHRCQIGYIGLPAYNSQGFGTEASDLLLQFAFESLNMHSVEALIDPRNIGSEKILLKSGFVKEGHLIQNVRFRGEYCDTVIYSLLKSNYSKRGK